MTSDKAWQIPGLGLLLLLSRASLLSPVNHDRTVHISSSRIPSVWWVAHDKWQLKDFGRYRRSWTLPVNGLLWHGCLKLERNWKGHKPTARAISSLSTFNIFWLSVTLSLLSLVSVLMSETIIPDGTIMPVFSICFYSTIVITATACTDITEILLRRSCKGRGVWRVNLFQW